MKVTLLIPDKLTNPMGGMGEQARQVAKAMLSVNPSIKFNVISCWPQKIQEEQIYSNCINYFTDQMFLNTIENHAFVLEGDYSVFFYRKALEIEHPDIIHAFDHPTFVAGSLLAKDLNVPLVVTLQLPVSCQFADACFSNLERKVLNGAVNREMYGMTNADAIIQVHKEFADEMFPSVFGNKTFIVGNGVDIVEFQKTEDYIFPGKNKKKIVYIGRIAVMKNVLELVSASIPEDADLYIFGGELGADKEYMSDVLSQIEKKENVYYCGPIYGQEKINMMMSADYGVFPSSFEPFGIVGLEWLAAGVPLIATNIGGMKSYLHANNYIHTGTSAKEISESIEYAMQKDEQEIKRMIIEGKKTCKLYSWGAIASHIDKVYQYVIDEYGEKK